MDEDDLPDDPFQTSVAATTRPVLTQAMIRMRGLRGTVAAPLANLALDLALYPKALGDVAASWGVSERTLSMTLSRNKMLSDSVTAIKREVESGGAIRAKAKMLLDRLLPELETIATDVLTAPRDKNKTIALVAELADAMPKPEANNGTGPMLFAVTFGNLEAAAALAPAPLYMSPSGPVIDAEDVPEADFSE